MPTTPRPKSLFALTLALAALAPLGYALSYLDGPMSSGCMLLPGDSFAAVFALTTASTLGTPFAAYFALCDALNARVANGFLRFLLVAALVAPACGACWGMSAAVVLPAAGLLHTERSCRKAWNAEKARIEKDLPPPSRPTADFLDDCRAFPWLG